MNVPSLPSRTVVYGSVAWVSALAMGVVAAVNIALLIVMGLGLVGK